MSDFPNVIDLSALALTDGFVIPGNAQTVYAGLSVSSAGDVNSDGFDDVIAGVPEGRDGGHLAGQAYVIFGQAVGPGDIDLTNLTASQGFIIQGDAPYEYFGASVSSAGDFNGDGLDDLIVGAPDGNYERGEAYVIFGQASGSGDIDLKVLTASQGFKIHGDAHNDSVGSSVSSAGDFNGDGFDDIITGARSGFYGSGELTPSGSGKSEVYVIFGSASSIGDINVATLTASQGFIIEGDTGESAGFSVSSAGDVNDDGFDDIIIGAPYSNDGGNNAGEAYVIYGRAPGEAVTRFGSEADQTIRGGAFNDQLNGLGGDDSLFGGGGSDLVLGGDGNDVLEGMMRGDALLGGEGVDTAGYQASTDSVAVNIGNGTGAGAHAADDVLVGIENLTGSEFGDLLRGGAATANNSVTDNVLSGMGGGDVILGDEGNDTISGGAGGDIMSGGAGNDAFVFDNLSSERDIVIDFDQNGDDAIIFRGFGAGFDFSDIQIINVNDTTADGIDNGDAFITAASWIGNVVLKDAFTLVDAGDFVFE